MKKYDGLWELNAIQEKEIWANNLVKVSVNDITKTLPSYMKSDMIYSDPPWSLGHENMFRKFAGKNYHENFNQFYESLFKHIKDIDPRVCYLEIGKQNLALFESKLKNIFPFVQVWEIKYYNKYKCYLLRGGKDCAAYDFTNLDDTVTPEIAIKLEKPKCVAELCTGRGITAMAAISNNVKFVGTELIKEKLAVLLNKINKNNVYEKIKKIS